MFSTMQPLLPPNGRGLYDVAPGFLEVKESERTCRNIGWNIVG